MEVLNQILTFIAICVALYGIDAWRREHVGKRQVELAEDSLALFYEASDIIKHIRHPVGYSSETESIERGEHESDAQFSARKNASIVFHRYNQHQELFNKIYASRYRFMAQIGKDKAKPFDDLRVVVNEIIGSARILTRLWARDNFRTDEQWQQHMNQVEKHEAVFWDSMGEEDLINPRIDIIIENIEEICQAVIEGKGSIYGFLNQKLGKCS